MTTAYFPSALVSAHWLAQHLQDDGLVVLDASVPPIVPFTSTRLPESLAGQAIPGALRFDYDTQICDRSSPLPHMMPDAELFTSEVQKLGINQDTPLVVYDSTGVYASPRAWWMFRAMGHDNVAVLDGGLPGWCQAGFPTAPGPAKQAKTPGDFVARPRQDLFCDAIAVFQSLHNDGCSILDARSPGRFQGRDPEPRPHLRGGHMPGARNLPFAAVLDDIHMKPVSALREIFQVTNPQSDRLILTCGSGLTACILALAAWLAGNDQLSVYDGSWAEWGIPSKLPVVTD